MLELLKKLGISEEHQAEILAAHNKGLTLLEGEKNTLVAQLKEKEESFAKTLDNYKDYEDIKSQLDKTVSEYDGFKQKFEEVEKNHTTILNDTILQKEIEKSLISNNVKYADLLMQKFDKAALKVKNGAVEGLETQLEALKANYPDFFIAQNTVSGQTPVQKTNSPEFLDVSKMTAEQVAKNWDKIRGTQRRL